MPFLWEQTIWCFLAANVFSQSRLEQNGQTFPLCGLHLVYTMGIDLYERLEKIAVTTFSKTIVRKNKHVVWYDQTYKKTDCYVHPE